MNTDAYLRRLEDAHEVQAERQRRIDCAEDDIMNDEMNERLSVLIQVDGISWHAIPSPDRDQFSIPGVVGIARGALLVDEQNRHYRVVQSHERWGDTRVRVQPQME